VRARDLAQGARSRFVRASDADRATKRATAKAVKPGSVRPVNVRGGSADPERGSWCTPSWLAEKLGRFDLDPCSNERSHVRATRRLALTDGEDGLAENWLLSPFVLAGPRVFINPPYERGSVLRWLRAYERARWCFLLRFDPSTEWFREIYRRAALVCVTRRRVNFEPPPGVPASSQPFPHAVYYKHAEDATDAILRACVSWRTGHG
jgi:hypothetical protein